MCTGIPTYLLPRYIIYDFILPYKVSSECNTLINQLIVRRRAIAHKSQPELWSDVLPIALSEKRVIPQTQKHPI